MIKNYKIDNVDHAFFPDEINCNLISIDIDFICLPKSAVDYFKNEFYFFFVPADYVRYPDVLQMGCWALNFR